LFGGTLGKSKTLYEIREFAGGSLYSKSLGMKLRPKTRAAKICKRLAQQGRDLFLVKFVIRY